MNNNNLQTSKIMYKKSIQFFDAEPIENTEGKNILFVDWSESFAELVWFDNFEGFCEAVIENRPLFTRYEFDKSEEMAMFVEGLVAGEPEDLPTPRIMVLRSDIEEHMRYIDYLLNVEDPGA